MITPADHLAILTLYAAYNRAIDCDDDEGWAATFVADGVFAHPARIWRGTNELRRFIVERKERSGSPLANQRHWNGVITLQRERNQILGACDLIVTAQARESGGTTILAQGFYTDQLVDTPVGWRFAQRTLQLA